MISRKLLLPLLSLLPLAAGCSPWTLSSSGDPNLEPPRILAGGSPSNTDVEIGRGGTRDGDPAAFVTEKLSCVKGAGGGFCNIRVVIAFTRNEPSESVGIQVQNAAGSPLRTIFLKDESVISENTFIVGVPCQESIVVKFWINPGQCAVPCPHFSARGGMRGIRSDEPCPDGENPNVLRYGRSRPASPLEQKSRATPGISGGRGRDLFLRRGRCRP